MNVDSADKLGRPLAVASLVVAIAAITAAVFTMGTPAQQRRVRIDTARIGDLDHLVDAVRADAKANGKLPPNLGVVAGKPGRSLRVDDREARGSYEYAVIDATHFKVCATFATDTASHPARGFPASRDEWAHAAGRQCFTRTLRGSDDDAAAAAAAAAAAVISDDGGP
jgi:hypothetical protein